MTTETIPFRFLADSQAFGGILGDSGHVTFEGGWEIPPLLLLQSLSELHKTCPPAQETSSPF